MEKENIARFFSAVMTDKALAEKVASLATEHGCDFTAEELLELGAARPLSDDEVAGAAGGIPNSLLFFSSSNKDSADGQSETPAKLRSERSFSR